MRGGLIPKEILQGKHIVGRNILVEIGDDGTDGGQERFLIAVCTEEQSQFGDGHFGEHFLCKRDKDAGFGGRSQAELSGVRNDTNNGPIFFLTKKDAPTDGIRHPGKNA